MSASIIECKPHDPAAVGWYLAYTKPRSEQAASAQLARQGYAIYLPLYKTLVRTAEGWRFAKRSGRISLPRSYPGS